MKIAQAFVSWRGWILADRALAIASWSFAAVAGLSLLLMCVVIAVEVIARDVFLNPFIDTVMTGRLTMVLIVYLGLAWAMRKDRHIRATFLVERLPPGIRAWIGLAELSISLFAVAVLIWQTWSFAYDGLRLGLQILGGYVVPGFPFFVLIPLGLSLLGLEILRRIVLDFRAHRASTYKGSGTI